MPTQEDDSVSADLAGFVDPDMDEVAHWERFDRQAQILCEPLARMIGHKNITFALGKSGGQLTRELSSAYDNNLSLSTGLYILRASQNEKLARVLICDGAGYQLSEPQKRTLTPAEELRALKAECRAAGPAGSAILEAAYRRAKGGR